MEHLPFEIRSDTGYLIAAFRDRAAAERYADSEGAANKRSGGMPVKLIEVRCEVVRSERRPRS